jgi:hypothetical protein
MPVIRGVRLDASGVEVGAVRAEVSVGAVTVGLQVAWGDGPVV